MYGLLMGITAGVMICLSFLDLVNKAWQLAGPVSYTHLTLPTIYSV